MDVQYQKQDLVATTQLMTIYMAKLNKAIETECFPEACSALRAMQDECAYASKVAMKLSVNSHLNDQRR